MTQIPEPDWKLLRRFQPLALERFCERVLTESVKITSDETKSFQDRYLELFSHVKSQEKDLAGAFDGMSRSRAIERILLMRSMGLFTEDEFSQFSHPKRELVDGWLNRG